MIITLLSQITRYGAKRFSHKSISHKVSNIMGLACGGFFKYRRTVVWVIAQARVYEHNVEPHKDKEATPEHDREYTWVNGNAFRIADTHRIGRGVSYLFWSRLPHFTVRAARTSRESGSLGSVVKSDARKCVDKDWQTHGPRLSSLSNRANMFSWSSFLIATTWDSSATCCNRREADGAVRPYREGL